ncbi:MAG: trigger factor [Clostridia bacterium]|nr:trigger factor [Clostridia bacterium]
MILKNSEKTAANTYKLEITVEKPEFDAALEKAYRKTAGRYRVQGFRAGKAPRRIIERLYGENVFYEEAINIAFPDAYSKAVEEAAITPVDRPELELSDINADGFTFVAVVTVKPEVTLGQYKGLEAEYTAPSVTDEDVDKELERRRNRAGRLETAERPAQNGDTVVIDFEGFVDDVAFEGGKGENHNLKLGSGQFIPGFEDQLVGKSAGEDVDVNVTFPEEYHAEELAGKAAVFKVKVHEVKENILPELDDEFAKDVSEFETLDAFKADLREKLLKSKTKVADDEFAGRVTDKLIENMEADIPDVMIENQLDHVCEDFEYRLRAQGMTLENYLKISGSDMEAFRANFRDQAERQVKTRLALDAVIKAEELSVTDEEIEKEYADMAEKYNTPVEEVKKYMSPEAVKEDMLTARAAEIIQSSAIKTEVKADEE